MVSLTNHVAISLRLNTRRQTTIATATRLPPAYQVRGRNDKLKSKSPPAWSGDTAAMLAEPQSELRLQHPFVIWLTGLSGAGKSTLAGWVSAALRQKGFHTYILDGDDLRHGLNNDLGFSAADRKENVRRLAHVASLMYDAGLITLVACISPFQSERDFARGLLPCGRFVEVFVDTPLSLCEKRDTKGLYRRARAGEISEFTGIDSPYERPIDAEIIVDTSGRSVSDSGSEVLDFLIQRELLKWPVHG
jgi:adenylyl-sulfate kinase